MDRDTFDTLVRRLHRDEIGRRQFVIGSLATAVGAAAVSRIAQAQDVDPTPTPPLIQGQSGETRQQFPCPPGPTGPFDPFDWICGTGPFDPWYPIIAPPDITAATGIRWYGFQGLEDGGLSAEAFDRTGKSVSYYQWHLNDGGGARWMMGGAGTGIEGVLNAPRANSSQVELSGEVNGNPFRVMVDEDGVVELDPDRTIALSADQQPLLAQWQPAIERADALLELALTTDQNPVAASDTGCFIAGYLAVPGLALCWAGPVGCVAAGGVGAYIVKNCTDSW